MKIIKNLNIITDKDIEEYLSFSGIGACGSVSKVLHEYGYGKLVFGEFRITRKNGKVESFSSHYWIETNKGDIIDLTNDYIDPIKEEYLNPQEISDVDGFGIDDIKFFRDKARKNLDGVTKEEIFLLKQLFQIQRYIKIHRIARFLNVPIPTIKDLLDSLELRHFIVIRGGRRIMKPFEITKKYLMRGRPIKSIYTEDEPEYRISKKGIFFLSKFNFI